LHISSFLSAENEEVFSITESEVEYNNAMKRQKTAG